MDRTLEDFDRGLAFDITRVVQRRQALKMLAGGSALAFLAACSANSKESSDATPDATAATSANTTGDTTIGTAECTTEVPAETGGPFPGDGSNGPNALADPNVVREDITGSFGDFTGIAVGVPTTIKLTVLDSANGCQPLARGAVYLWHADKDGLYSMYTASEANYLRGVGEADSNGTVTFQSIWPGCYDGRWPHIHFEVYPSVDDALGTANLIKTSQIAMPEAECKLVYEATGYESSVPNLTHVSLTTDMVFSDGWDQELGVATGSNDSGWTVALTITV